MPHNVPGPVKAIISNPVSTRNDLIDLLQALLNPLLSSLSSGGARVRIGHSGTHFDAVAAEFEGYARSLWGLAPIFAAEPDNVQLKEFRDGWVKGLENGTDPEHEEYWGDHIDKDQRFVEMAAVGFTIAIAPKVFWEPLDKAAKGRVNHWLLQANKFDFPTNNWRFFRIFINLGMKLVGGEYDQGAIDRELAFIDGFYGEHGFPSDGPSDTCKAFDYYATSFAIPFYSLIYAKLCGSFDADRAALYRKRALANIPHVVHLFAPDGAAIPFGRSMTYRFAVSAFWGALAYDDVELPAPFTWGVVKGLVLRNIRWFTQKEEVFNRDGTLSIGWSYPTLFMSEDYNSAQSPYWALKAFLPLALPASHPFWTSKEEAYPTSLLKEPYHIVKPWMQVFTHASDHTFLLNSGQQVSFPMRQAAAKYGKFAYSSTFGFSVPTGALGLQQHAPDSVLALSDDEEGERWVVPRVVEHRGISENGVISSVWKPWPDVTVETYLIPPPTTDSAYHTRIHHITSARTLHTAESGFAIHSHSGPPSSERRMLQLKEATEGTAGRLETTSTALAVSRVGASGVIDLLGNGKGKVQDADGNSNLCFPRTVFPTILGEVTPGGEGTWIAVRVFAQPFGESQLGHKGWVEGWKGCQDGWKSVEAMRRELGI